MEIQSKPELLLQHAGHIPWDVDMAKSLVISWSSHTSSTQCQKLSVHSSLQLEEVICYHVKNHSSIAPCCLVFYFNNTLAS